MPNGLRTIAIVYFIIGIIGVILLKPKPKASSSEQKEPIMVPMMELKAVGR